MSTGTWAWLESGQVFIPDTRIREHRPGQTYEGLRGYGHSLAVLVEGKCVGYIMVEDLGFENAKAWLLSTRGV